MRGSFQLEYTLCLAERPNVLLSYLSKEGPMGRNGGAVPVGERQREREWTRGAEAVW